MKRINVPFGVKYYTLDVLVKLSANYPNDNFLYREVVVKSAIPNYDWDFIFIYGFRDNCIMEIPNNIDKEFVHQIAAVIKDNGLLNYFILPSREQLKQVIYLGDPEVNNSVVLLNNGIFNCFEFDSIQYGENRKKIVARFETLAANGGDVGVTAANDEHLVRNIYFSLLAGWLIHLKTGRMDIYYDCNPINSEEEFKLQLDTVLKSRFK